MARFVFLIVLLSGAPATAATGPQLELESHAASVRRQLKNVEGVTVSVEGPHVVIDGDVLTREDMDRVVRVTGLFPDCVSLVTMHPQVAVNRAALMERAIHRNKAMEAVTVELHNDTFFLQGAVADEADRMLAGEIAETYLPELMKSEAVKQGVLTEAVKKFAIRNLIQVVKRSRR